MFKKFLYLIISIFLLNACDLRKNSDFKVGTMSGPETQLMEVAEQVAEKKFGLTFSIVEFSDYNEPNAALDEGSLCANMFQHKPYLDRQIKDRHYKLVAVANTFVFPMGAYSKKHKTLDTLADNALIAIPSDPSNEGRALLLLEKNGLIKLKASAGLYATPLDVEDNPKKLRFKELDAAQLSRVLDDVDLALINTNFAIPAGLKPTVDAIFHEESDSSYGNIIVVREKDANNPKILQLVEAFQSPEVIDAANKLFQGQAIPAWKN